MNTLMPTTTTATELQRNYKKIVKKAKETKQPIVVLSNNKPIGIYMDYSAFFSQKAFQKKAKTTTNFSEFLGVWSKKEAKEFDKIIKNNFEKIDSQSW